MEHVSIHEFRTFDDHGSQANITDGLLAIASAINRLADAVEGLPLDTATEITQALSDLIEERETQVNIDHDR